MANTRANNSNTPSSIVFPSRAKRDEGRLRDCFRIMAWKQFKQEYRGDLTGLNLYAVFEEDWKKHEIQGWDYQKMSQFADELGYSAAELLKARNRYYELRDQARGRRLKLSSNQCNSRCTSSRCTSSPTTLNPFLSAAASAVCD
jgi:hypothetical protein